MSESDYPAGAFHDDDAPFNQGLKHRRKRVTQKPLNKFQCSECQTKYSSPETTPPPGIKWDDGHVCTPIPDEDE